MELVEVTSGAPPSVAVLAAFGLAGGPAPLSGGQGRSWLVGQAVLKPLDMPQPALRRQAELLTRLDCPGRLSGVGAAAHTQGAWTSHGWTASRYEPGVHLPGSWHEIVAVGQRLHVALQDEPESALLADRTDIWAIADRVAWRERPAEDQGETKHLNKLIVAWRPVRAAPNLCTVT